MEHIDDIDPLKQAVYDVVKGFKGGVTGLAKRLGTNAGTLQNKVNRNNEHLYVHVSELRQITLITQDFRALDQLNIDCGRISVPLPESAFPADMDLLTAAAEWQSDVGKTSQALRDVVADGKVTGDELRRMREEIIRDFQWGLAMVAVLEGMAEPEKVTSIQEARRG